MNKESVRDRGGCHSGRGKEKEGGKKEKNGGGAGKPKNTARGQMNDDDSNEDEETVEQLLVYIYHPASKGKKGTEAVSKQPIETAFVDLEERGLLARVWKAVKDTYKAKSMGYDPRGKMYTKASKSAKTVEAVPEKSSEFYGECKFLQRKKNEFGSPKAKGKAVEKFKIVHIMGTAERPNLGDDEDEDEEGDEDGDESYSQCQKARRSPVAPKSKNAAAQSDQEARSRALQWLSARSKAQENMNSMHFQLYLAFLTGNVISNTKRDRILDSDSWPDDAEDMPDWTSAQNKALHGPPPADGAHPLDSFGKAPKYKAPRAGDEEGESLAGAMHAIARGMSGAGGGGGGGGRGGGGF